jgi:uncharacterized membrane protein SpoIIM required for sporulation
MTETGESAQSSDRTWERWLSERVGRWRALTRLTAGNRRDQTLAETRELLAGYRETARELALARRVAPQSLSRRALESVYATLHQTIHRRPTRPAREIVDLYLHAVPAAAHRLRSEIFVVTALFLSSAFGGAMLATTFPDTATLFMSSPMIESVQRGQLWTADILNIVPSSVLSFNLMTNNITVALTCFAMGAIYGLGTLYIVGLNGLMLGFAFAYTARFGLGMDLFRFVVAHGIVELSVICLAGAAGLALGRALARPGAGGRIHSVRATMPDAGSLAAVSVPFLVGCAIIEGYLSPDPEIGLNVRIAVGLVWFIALLVVLDGRWWNRSSSLTRGARDADSDNDRARAYPSAPGAPR